MILCTASFILISGVEEVDYTRYPNKEYQIDWLKSYLEYSQSFSESITEIKEKDVERLYVWVQKFSLVSKQICCYDPEKKTSINYKCVQLKNSNL